MATNFSPWIGKPVVMNVMNGNASVSLCCTVVQEFAGMVRIRISNQWDVDIYKNMIGGIESDAGSAQAELVSFFEH